MPDTPSWKTLYPYASREIDVDGLRLHYVDEGAGRPILCVHGNPTWSFYYRSVIDAFRDRYRVVAPDHIGCGLSDKPEVGEYPFTLDRRIEDLKRLIVELDLTDITLLAHDWGGAIGLGAAVDMPERFSRIALLNTGAFTGERCPWRIRVCRIPGFGAVALRGLNLFSLMALRMAVERVRSLGDEAAHGLLAPYDSWSHRAAVHQFVLDIPLAKTHRSYERLLRIEQGLPTLADRPISLIWGMKDWCFTPNCLDRFIGFFPNAEVHRLHDVGHYVLEDAPQETVAILDEFLGRSLSC